MRVYGATGTREERGTEVLGKSAALTRLVVTAEATHGERNLHRVDAPGKINRVAAISVVDPDTGDATRATASASHRPIASKTAEPRSKTDRADRDGKAESCPERSGASIRSPYPIRTMTPSAKLRQYRFQQ